MSTQKLSREEVALREVGNTTVARWVALVLSLSFLLIIFLVPLLQESLLSLRPGAAWPRFPHLFSTSSLNIGPKQTVQDLPPLVTRFQVGNNALLQEMTDFEKHLEQKSFLRDYLLHPGQFIFLEYLGIGNENVYPGEDGWLFYRPDVDHVIGPGFLDKQQMRKKEDGRKPWEPMIFPDPIPAILNFQQQLAERNISLLLLPIPVKPTIESQKFYAKHQWQQYPRNRSWQSFLKKISQAGVLVFDPLTAVAKQDSKNNGWAYLKTDTHWRPETMELIAKHTADVLRQHVSFSGPTSKFKRHEMSVSNRGDIDAMLQFDNNWNIFAKDDATLKQVVTSGDELWKPEPESEVLFLGDSFANIFSLAEMGWGESAGIVEQLSYYLQRPVDMILQNDAGSYATREILSTGLARGRDRLAGKKIVVWQFAVRELSQGNWKLLPLTLGNREEASFFLPEPGAARQISGTVAAIARSPRPGTVPYKDNIITLHLEDVADLESGESLGQVLAYGWGMRDNILTDLSRARIGDAIQLNLVDWYDVEAQYTSFRRSALEDEMLELEQPCWAEVLQ